MLVWTACYQFVFQHLLRIKIRDEEADIITLDLLPPENEEVLGPPHHEAGELVAEKPLDVVCLLDCDGDSHRIDARLYENFLSLVPGDDDGVEENLRRLLDLYLRLVVSLHLLTGEVLQTHGGLQGPLDTDEVGVQ